MQEESSLADLKERLILLGVSTSTPGLRGKDRLEELRRRIDCAQRGEPVHVLPVTSTNQKAESAAQPSQPSILTIPLRTNPSRPSSSHSSSSNVDGANELKTLVMSMSSSQLRENLTLLGQSTSSEGLSGEERRQELARRLMDALARPDLPPGFVSAMRRRIAEDAEVDDPATKAKLIPLKTPRRLDPIESAPIASSTGPSLSGPALVGSSDLSAAVLFPARDRPASSSAGSRLAPIAATTSNVEAAPNLNLKPRVVETNQHQLKGAPTDASPAVATLVGEESADPEEDIFDPNSRLSIRQSEGQGKLSDSSGSFATPKFVSASSIESSFNFSKLGSMMSDNFEGSRGMFQHGEDGDEDFQDHGLFDPDEAEDESHWLEGIATNDMTEAQRAVFVDSIRNERRKIKGLLSDARRFESAGNLDAAQERYSSALEINPHDVYTLQRYATFMHSKRLDVEKAAAFYKRAVKECVPSLISELKTQKIPTGLNAMRQYSSVYVETPKHKKSSVSAADITKLLIHYGRFLVGAQGNEPYAEAVFKKAVEISPDDSTALATYAHFLSSSTSHFPPPPKGESRVPPESTTTESSAGPNDGEGPSLPKETPNPVAKPELLSRSPSHQRSVRPGSRGRQEEAEELFRQSIKAEPTNALHLLWYARLLKNLGKYPQADIMFAACLKLCVGRFASLEPTAYCNYATFVVKYRRDRIKAEELFRIAISKYPDHKQLAKNYNYFSNKGKGSRRSKGGSKRPPPQVSPQLREQLSIGLPLGKDKGDSGAAASSEGFRGHMMSIGDDFRGLLSLMQLSCSDIIQEELGPPGGADNPARARIGGLVVLGPDDVDVMISVTVSPGKRSFEETPLIYDSLERYFKSKLMTPSSDDIMRAVEVLEGDAEGIDPEAWGASTQFGPSMIGASISTVVSVAIHQIDKRSGQKILLSYVNLSVLDILSSKEVGDYVYCVERAFACEQVEKQQLLGASVANTFRLSGKVTLLMRIDRLEKSNDD